MGCVIGWPFHKFSEIWPSDSPVQLYYLFNLKSEMYSARCHIEACRREGNFLLIIFFKSKRSRTYKKSRKLEAANSASKVEEVCAQPAADQGPITASVDVWLVRSKTTTCHWLDRGRQMKAALMCCFSALLVSPRLCKQLPRNRIDFWTKNEK